MAVIITSTHFAYPRRDGQAELAWVAGYIQRWCAKDDNTDDMSTMYGIMSRRGKSAVCPALN